MKKVLYCEDCFAVVRDGRKCPVCPEVTRTAAADGVLGIIGDYGSGKTSYLAGLHRALLDQTIDWGDASASAMEQMERFAESMKRDHGSARASAYDHVASLPLVLASPRNSMTLLTCDYSGELLLDGASSRYPDSTALLWEMLGASAVTFAMIFCGDLLNGRPRYSISESETLIDSDKRLAGIFRRLQRINPLLAKVIVLLTGLDEYGGASLEAVRADFAKHYPRMIAALGSGGVDMDVLAIDSLSGGPEDFLAPIKIAYPIFARLKNAIPHAAPANGHPDRPVVAGSSHHDVFISYSSADKAVADAVCHRLEAAGIRCWIAPRDILPGRDYGEAILDGIEQCRLVVVVFSASSNGSKHVQREVERAVSKEKPILPFRIDAAIPSRSLEYFISGAHWLDAMTPPLDSHIDRLIEVANKLAR